MEMPESRTAPDLLAEMAGKYPDAEFVIDARVRLGYEEFRARSRTFARALHAIGIARGDKPSSCRE